MKRDGHFDQRLLAFVTLGLVAFGLVMVYSATSASAAVGGRDPSYYLKRQAVFAVLGVGAMIFGARWRYRALRPLAPTLLLGSLVLLAGVLARGAAVTIALGFVAIWFEPYRRARVFSFFNPWGDAQGAGFQSVQALIGLGSGGFLGTGLGHGVEKVLYLPEAHTHMIFAVIGEELGLLGTTFVIAMYAAFAYVGLRIALAARDPFAKRLAAGLTVLVCGQAALNVAAVVGIAPLTGVTLPFVSYGGTSLVVSLASVGVLLNIARNDVRERSVALRDRSRGDGRPRAAVARRRGSTARPERAGDLRRVGGPRRVAARP